MDIAVELVDVEYAYPDGCKAIAGVRLRIMRGERIAIIGPNGAGKSTLLMLINGLLTPSKGHVSVFGTPVKESNLREVRAKVGFVFQDPDDQLFCPTLWEDIAFGPLNLGLSEREIEERVEKSLEIVGLMDHGDKPPHHLSVGEKKRAAMATVLAMKPEIMILDEPTANLDPGSRRELIEFLEGLHKIRKNTLILATHDMDLVPILADRVCILKGGKLIAEGPAREILSNSSLLHEAKLEPPAITRLFNRLRERGYTDLFDMIPLTTEEAVSELIKHDRKHTSKEKAII